MVNSYTAIQKPLTIVTVVTINDRHSQLLSVRIEGPVTGIPSISVYLLQAGVNKPLN